MTTIDLTENINFASTDVMFIEKNINNNILFKLILTDADFEAVIDWIPFNETSNIDSLVYKYNTDYDYAHENFTQISRLQEFFDQLVAITNLVHIDFLSYLNALKEICNSALQNGNRLFIKIE
jgi:hypothetical protein